MEVFSHNNELIYAQSQFMRLFNNIKLLRKDKNNKDIIVKCMFGKRSRVFKTLENSNYGQLVLPAIYFSRTSLSRNPQRLTNLHNEIYNKNQNLDYNLLTPVPIDIVFELVIVTKYPEDMDIILSNFIPFFNQDIYVKIKNPKDETKKINHQVIWSNEINEEWPDELDGSNLDIQIATTSFTFKTYLFGGDSQLAQNTNLINVIDFSITAPTVSGDLTTGIGGYFPVPTLQSFDDYYANIETNGLSGVIYDPLIINENDPGYS